MSIKYDLSMVKTILAGIILYNNETNLLALSAKYERFIASSSGVPIFSRTFDDETKINNQINNDFIGDVIDTKLGYMISIPITYNYEIGTLQKRDGKNPTVVDENMMSVEQEVIDNFIKKNNIDDLNLETVKFTSVCGTSPRLFYIDTDGEIAALNFKPWEVVYVYNDSETKLLAAVRYYIETVVDNEFNQKSLIKVEFYTDNEVHYLIEETIDNDGSTAAEQSTSSIPRFEYDESVEGGPVQKHGFNRVPITEYVNNEERQGDCDKILPLIDAYDRILSDQASEIEQFRLAYLAVYGLEATDEDLAKLKQTGAFKMTADGKVEFITKDMNATALENLISKLEENIFKFARSANFSDQSFFGNLSGIAIKYKLIKLEHKCSVTEMKMKRADLDMWDIISDAYAKKRVFFDPFSIARTFTRKIPVNLLEEARIQRELKGLVSNETRLALASFVTNPHKEIQKIQKEMESGITSMLDNFYDTLEDVAPDEGTMSDNEQFNEWRLEHRNSGKAPEAINDDESNN